jgi:hypothetical protein
MLKVLVLAAQNNVSDGRSSLRFLGFDLGAPTPSCHRRQKIIAQFSRLTEVPSYVGRDVSTGFGSGVSAKDLISQRCAAPSIVMH